MQTPIKRKRHRQRPKTVSRHSNFIQERISFGEEAKQNLRNLSLINNSDNNAEQQWTKSQDFLSIQVEKQIPEGIKSKISLDKRSTPRTPKKNIFFPRKSQPQFSNRTSRSTVKTVVSLKTQAKLQVTPTNYQIQNYKFDSIIHATSNNHNPVLSNKLHLINALIYRKPIRNIQQRSKSLPTQDRQSSYKVKYKNQYKQVHQLEIIFQNGCSQIEPLRESHVKKQQAVKKAKQQIILYNKANSIVRKMLREKQKSNFNENIFSKVSLIPQF